MRRFSAHPRASREARCAPRRAAGLHRLAHAAVGGPGDSAGLQCRREARLRDRGRPPLGGNRGSVLLGNGAGGFGAKTDFATGTNPYSLAIGDLNGDAKPDLAVANLNSNTVSVLLGNGAGGFGAKTDFATG